MIADLFEYIKLFPEFLHFFLNIELNIAHAPLKRKNFFKTISEHFFKSGKLKKKKTPQTLLIP